MKRETTEHNGHRIEVPGDESDPWLVIDDEPVRWGRFSGDDQFFLYAYAYDPDDSLVEVAKRYVEYRDKVGCAGSASGE